MIDYTKIYLINIDVNRLLKLECLDFKIEVSTSTGEVSTTQVATYNHCKITVKVNTIDKTKPHVYFTGSIHKLYNQLNNVYAPNYNSKMPYKGYNGNQFNLNDIIETKLHLKQLFDCNASQMVFENIEFGINTILDFKPKLFLKGLLFHINKEFQFELDGNNSQCIHNRFIFKIYNKSYQYNLVENVLRVELKIKKMIELKNLNIKTFADINENALNKVKDLLLKRFDEVVYYDYTIRESELSNTNLKLIKLYSNVKYWCEKTKPIHRDRPKKNLKRIIEKYSDNLHQQIRTQIIEKCVTINRLSGTVQNTNCVTINYESILLDITQTKVSNNKLCKVTGLNISMQKNNSLTLSFSGLRYLHQNDIKTFERLKNKYLSKVWINSSLETQIHELAHNIRNKKSNAIINHKRIYQPQQLNFLSQF